MSVVYSNFATVKYSRNCPEMEYKNSDTIQRCHYQQSSGLLRYRSAPSSLLSSLGETSHGCVSEAEEASRGLDHHHQQSGYAESLGSEMEAMMTKLAASSSNNGWSNVKQEEEERKDPVFCHGGGSGSGSDQMMYHSQEFLGFPSGCSSSSSRAMMNLEISNQSKMGYGNCSNPLMRQKSSPAGFLSNLSLTNGFAAVGEEATTSSSVTFSCRPSSSSSCPRRMPQIAENGSETLNEEPTTTCVQGRNLRDENGCNTSYNNIPSFTNDLWENSAFTAQKTACDSEEFMFSASSALETQHAGFGYQNLGLTHQLSLPNSSSSHIAAIERFLQVQGSVPCKIRAKRGFATHPRSIAERVRRSRISERIKKLQELFPKIDKQTSTADMLDLAVDYIKELQEQVKILADSRAKCSCSRIQKQYS